MDDATEPCTFFVYGTLKKGQCREKCWPAKPHEIVPSWIRGTLYDLTDYPAIVEGTDKIAGELWSFLPGDVSRVRQTLDQIEITNQPGIPNEYDRIQTEVFDMSMASRSLGYAYCYRYSKPKELVRAKRVIPSTDHFPETQGEEFALWTCSYERII